MRTSWRPCPNSRVAFVERRCDFHLVVAHAPEGICENPAAAMKLLIERLQPEGGFALSGEQTSSETTLRL